MGGAEGVVDIDVAQRGELFRKFGIVLFFFGMIAEVFEQQDFAGLRAAWLRPRGRCNRGPF